jgi:hypothetical protein
MNKQKFNGFNSGDSNSSELETLSLEFFFCLTKNDTITCLDKMLPQLPKLLLKYQTPLPHHQYKLHILSSLILSWFSERGRNVCSIEWGAGQPRNMARFPGTQPASCSVENVGLLEFRTQAPATGHTTPFATQVKHARSTTSIPLNACGPA